MPGREIRSMIEKALGRSEGKAAGRELRATKKPTKDPYDDYTDEELQAEIFRRGAGSPSGQRAKEILQDRKIFKPKAALGVGAAAGLGGALYSNRKK